MQGNHQHHLPRSPTEKCTVGCPLLDRCLAGGIPCNSITEIVAESGLGKTQLCLQLALRAQLPISNGGLHASSLYLHTEFPFPHRRLHQLSNSFRALCASFFLVEADRNGDSRHDPCDHIYVESIHSADQLLDIMPRIEFSLLNPQPARLPIRLIVIDSVAALFRSDFDNTASDLRRRSTLLFQISGKLKRLATLFNLAVVVTNQVVDVVEPTDLVNGLKIGNLRSLCSSGRRVCPALGLAWANCVNSRLFLSRDDDAAGSAGEPENGFARSRATRRLHVLFAPHLPPSSCHFAINRHGIFGIDH